MKTDRTVCGHCGQNYAVVEIRSRTVFECLDLYGDVLNEWPANLDDDPCGFYCHSCALEWDFCHGADELASPEDIAAAEGEEANDDDESSHLAAKRENER